MTRLRWTEVDTNWWAATGLVSYEARVVGDGMVMTRSSVDMRWFCFNGTLEEAKQAAQDDYDNDSTTR
jgi:hypothetical protein